MSDWRYFATRLHGDGTETLIHTELPLSGVALTDTLAGPKAIQATIRPQDATLLGSDGEPVFDAWATAIYAEKDGEIRGGSIVDELTVTDDGSALQLDCIGFAGYPKDMPYTEVYSKVGLDPADAFREIWRHLQAQRNGNLGVTISGTKTPIKLGTSPAKDVNFDTKDGEHVSFTIGGPYELAWYKTTDLLSEINKLATDTPLDYIETHRWASNSSDKILHHIELGYPTLGKRQHGLRFVVGENVYVSPDVLFPGDYASEVLSLGAGEGKKMLHATKARSGETRLRRVRVIDTKDADTQKRVDTEAAKELAASTGRPEVEELKVIDHPHAKLGSFNVGDEIFVQVPEGWQGDLGMWVRILAITITPDDESVAALQVARV